MVVTLIAVYQPGFFEKAGLLEPNGNTTGPLKHCSTCKQPTIMGLADGQTTKGRPKNNFPFFSSPHSTLSPGGVGTKVKLYFGRP